MLNRLAAAVVTVCALTACSAQVAATPTPPPSAAPSSPSASSTVALADARAGSLQLSQGWVVATQMAGSASPSGMNAMSAAYATVRNDGDAEDALVRVETKAAAMAQLHETVTSGNAGTMHEVPEIVVPAHGTATLQPGGYHVMLMNLTGPLQAGSTVEMTWTFRSGATITTNFPVIPRDQRPS